MSKQDEKWFHKTQLLALKHALYFIFLMVKIYYISKAIFFFFVNKKRGYWIYIYVVFIWWYSLQLPTRNITRYFVLWKPSSFYFISIYFFYIYLPLFFLLSIVIDSFFVLLLSKNFIIFFLLQVSPLETISIYSSFKNQVRANCKNKSQCVQKGNIKTQRKILV